MSATVLIVAEHENGALNESLKNALAAAMQLGGDAMEVLVMGDDGCRAVAEKAATVAGVNTVRLALSPALLLAENAATVIAREAKDCSHILMCASAKSRACLARAAALADCQMISDVVAVQDAQTFVRPIYAGNALTTVQSADAIKFISARATAFDAEEIGEQSPAPINEIDSGEDCKLSEITGEKVSELTRPELTGARIVVSGGRGMGGAENFKLLESIADKLGAAIGASRAAVDAGYVSNDFQVGQTGKIVAPDLYVAVGISGAIQHIAGIKDAKCIAAINKDPDAPIFDIADYGLVADLFEALPELEKALGE